MMNFAIVVTILLIITLKESNGCDILTDNNAALKLEIKGTGLHRIVSVKTHLSAKTRFSQCRLLYRFQIPRTMYIDDNALNRSLFEYNLVTFRPFDVEAVAKNSKSQKVYLIRKKLFLSTFEIKDELNFPIHMRYPPAGDKSSLHETVFRYPEIAVDCERNQFDKCPRFAVHPDDRLKSNSKNWILVDLPSKSETIVFQGDSTTVNDFQLVIYFSVLIITLLASLQISIF